MRARRASLGAFCLILGAALVSCAAERERSPLEGANVLFVLVDTLRVDHLGCFGYPEPTSPFLDRLCQRSVVFSNAVSTAAQTVPSVLSLMSGVYPRQHGNQYFSETNSFRVPQPDAAPRVPDDLPLLAEQLRARGYRTGAVVGNPWLKAEYGFARGFERYEYLAEKSAFFYYPRGRRVNAVALRALEAWKGEPFFLYLHYMEPHHPYRALPEHREQFAGALEGRPPDDPEWRRAIYDAAVRTADEYVRQLLVTVERLGLADSTLVVVTSDHGEELFDHGDFGHGHTLYEEQIASALLFSHPALAPSARTIRAPVSLVDLAPTILALTGAEAPADLPGISLAPWILGEADGPPPERALYSELATQKAVRKGSRKLIRRDGASEPVLAFDLVEDPTERNPVADARWRDDLESELAAFDATPARRAPTGDEIETVDPETRQRLEALGYGQRSR